MNKLQIALTSLVLALFSVLGVGVVAFMQQQTAPVIEAQARQALNRQLAAVLPAGFDNDPASTARPLPVDALLGGREGSLLYTARRGESIVGWAMRVIAPNGYSGAIHLLIGVDAQGQVSGVRVISHKETPGLGDPIEIEKSPWIDTFHGKTLSNPDAKGWGVKKDGGVFDQFTGATITPRAVVQAVHNALLYLAAHRQEFLEAKP